MDNLNLQYINNYAVQLVAERVWAVDEFGADICYVVEGTKKALVIDTGYGFGNLRGTVEKITKLPYEVVNTHGHMDHACGNGQFETTYMNPRDFFLITPEYIGKRWAKSCEKMRKEPGFTGGDSVNPEIVPKVLQPNPLEEYQIFNLGGRRLEVLYTPGHTPGSSVLLDADNRILFAGDTVVSTPILIFDEYSTTVEEYLEGLRKLWEREKEFDLIVSGHYLRPIGKHYLCDLIQCARSILDGTGRAESIDFSHMSDEPAVLYRYGKASIACSDGHIR